MQLVRKSFEDHPQGKCFAATSLCWAAPWPIGSTREGLLVCLSTEEACCKVIYCKFGDSHQGSDENLHIITNYQPVVRYLESSLHRLGHGMPSYQATS